MKALHALILLLVLSSCQAKTLTVDEKGSGDALNLQDAVGMAAEGDSILIMPGNYSGAKLDKSLNITGLKGANLEGSLIVAAPGCIISHINLSGPDDGPCISLASSGSILLGCNITSLANAVSISGEGNRVKNCTISSPRGVEILGAKNEILESSISAETAVVFNQTRGGLVEGCRISALRGVALEESHDSTVSNNSYSGSGLAIVLSRSHGNLVFGNILSGAMVSGIDDFQSQGNNHSQNTISGGQVGISLRQSQGCNITGNKCHKNERAGIFLEGGSDNSLQDNNLSENGNGILLQGSAQNVLANNSASQNRYGISIRACGENRLRHSSLWGNTYNLRIDSGQSGQQPSNYNFFVQDIDGSNLVDNKPVCYLVGEKDLVVPSDCGFLGLVSCKNIRAADLNITNSSAGVLLLNSTGCEVLGSRISRSEWGYMLEDCLSCIISDSQAANCTVGFSAKSTSSCRLERDGSANCSAEGFRADGSQGLALVQCDARACQWGISLHGCRLCRIQNCSAAYGSEDGIFLSNSHDCSLLANAATSCQRGISLAGSNSCLLQDNNVSGNEMDGISLQQLSSASLQGNAARHNGQGIFAQSCRGLNLKNNLLEENSRFGLRMSGCQGCNMLENSISGNRMAGANLVDCSGNMLYHNLFQDNGQNAADNGANQWDGGEEAGGNYWSDHQVEGNPSREARQIPGGGVDRYPFADPWGWR
ncbi:MAG: right-handed parallel beta-helix repeat-containing protein [Methanothrix sp.]|nr:right-handed parallel beta-helix repeat-containing protein [Methanothrix sp.]OYV13229.1 MAG: cell surface protein [Methanosaeta sp. ASM2]